MGSFGRKAEAVSVSEISLHESEIEVGKALTANIQALHRSLAALVMTEQIYIESLRRARGLGDEWKIEFWEKGFVNGNQDNQ